MVTIESTPQMATSMYAMMEKNLAIVRRRLGRALTLASSNPASAPRSSGSIGCSVSSSVREPVKVR